jgi:hypothetical protein
MSFSNLRDQLMNDGKVLINETLTNSALYYVIMMTGLDEKIFSSSDGDLVGAIKSGLVASAVNVAGANLRTMYPILNVVATD